METEYIAHRVNTVEELLEIPKEFGVEIDIRDFNEDVIIQHDPFKKGNDLEEYLVLYEHQTLIFNIKSERVEHKVLELIKKYKIKNYFFLDSTFPMINLMVNAGESNIAIRFSEFEGLDTILNMAGKVKWVWVDCFTKLPINRENYKILKEAGFKICLVSPELQGRLEDIKPYKEYFKKESIVFDAICTKMYNVELWKS